MKRLVVPFLFAMSVTACGPDAKVVQGLTGPAGTSGTNGTDGASPDPTASPSPGPYDVVSEIIPCGRKYSDDEIVQLLGNGTLQAVLNAHGQAYTDILAPGMYTTSDRKRCKFTVHSDNTVTW